MLVLFLVIVCLLAIGALGAVVVVSLRRQGVPSPNQGEEAAGESSPNRSSSSASSSLRRRATALGGGRSRTGGRSARTSRVGPAVQLRRRETGGQSANAQAHGRAGSYDEHHGADADPYDSEEHEAAQLEDVVDESGFVAPEGVGKRKLAKLMAKEEKRRLREAVDAQRRASREREDAEYEARKERERTEEEKERHIAEMEARRARELEEQEQREFEQWQDQIEVEGAGDADAAAQQRTAQLPQLIADVKSQRVVEVNDLAIQYGYSTMEMVEKLRELDESRELSGIIDDRGRFFHITEQDMMAVADFCQRRGRVSLQELVNETNRLIDLR
mmetsp:Transcript_10218/g.25671  ORF Transcript_10218/g.25671 Transcript_10218/m.25671 type:complete len:331 (-) Transcript_10218:1057-2049(-)